MKLSEFAGNKHIVKSIRDMIISNRIAGTYIFEGATGSGKSQIAKALAKTIVCSNSEYKQTYGEACGECDSCKKADMNIHPDLIISEPEESKADSFHIEQVRELIGDLYLTPNESDVKVYILEDMQNMTVQAQNALLKSIEEPPPFVVFIITVSSLDLILETVASRAVKFAMEYISGEVMREFIRKYFSDSGFLPDSEEINKAVRFSNGSIGAAIKILRKETAAYDEISPQIKNILFGKAKSNKADILESLQRLTMQNLARNELLNFYSALELAARDILTAKIFIDDIDDINDLENGNNGETSDFLEYFESIGEIEELVNLYSTEKILELLQNIHDFKSNLDYNINTKLNIAGFFATSG